MDRKRGEGYNEGRKMDCLAIEEGGNMSINRDEAMNMTYSAVVTKENKKAVCVRFERKGGAEYAEGILPYCDVVRQKGFSKEEIMQLENYLKANRSEILSKAKELNNFMNWF